jgi:hypothetical protein
VAKRDDAKGPIIRWRDYVYDGWRPESYDTIKEALEDDNYGNKFVITRIVQYDIQENKDYESENHKSKG